MKLETIILSFLLIFNFCTSTVFIKTQSDPNYDFNNCSSVVIYSKQKTIEEKKLKYILSQELDSIGLKIIEGTDDANLSTYFYIYKHSGEYNGNLILPKTTSTTGHVGTIPYYENTTSTQVVPYTESYSYKKLHITDRA